jgi:hypothetical protein
MCELYRFSNSPDALRGLFVIEVDHNRSGNPAPVPSRSAYVLAGVSEEWHGIRN